MLAAIFRRRTDSSFSAFTSLLFCSWWYFRTALDIYKRVYNSDSILISHTALIISKEPGSHIRSLIHLIELVILTSTYTSPYRYINCIKRFAKFCCIMHKTNNTIHWIVTFLVDSIVHLLNNPGLEGLLSY